MILSKISAPLDKDVMPPSKSVKPLSISGEKYKNNYYYSTIFTTVRSGYYDLFDKYNVLILMKGTIQQS